MIASRASGLLIYRKLDPKLTTDAFKAYVAEKEGGSPDFVEADRIRDLSFDPRIIESERGVVASEEFQKLARKNLERLGLDARVEFKLRDITAGCDETDADAFFLDVPNPWDYVQQVWTALKPGGFFCNLVPTFNQVETLLFAGASVRAHERETEAGSSKKCCICEL